MAGGDAVTDLSAVVTVHPMREDAVRALLLRDGADWSVVEELVRAGKLVELCYSGHRFYLRVLPSG